MVHFAVVAGHARLCQGKLLVVDLVCEQGGRGGLGRQRS